jgi:hypothetical protein
MSDGVSTRSSCAPSPTCARRSNGTYVKVAFFRGTSLRPVPPGESKHKEVRYVDIREDDQVDEAQMATWIRQAAALPG